MRVTSCLISYFPDFFKLGRYPVVVVVASGHVVCLLKQKLSLFEIWNDVESNSIIYQHYYMV